MDATLNIGGVIIATGSGYSHISANAQYGSITGTLTAGNGYNYSSFTSGLDITGMIAVSSGAASVYAGRNFAGNLQGGTGSSLAVQAGYNVTGLMNVGPFSSVIAAYDIAGTITASGNIDTLRAGFIPDYYNSVTVAGATISGVINSGQTIGTLIATAGINVTATAYGSILAINLGTGNLAGSFTAQHGSLPDINCTGSITAILTGASIGNLTALQNISGTILATGGIASVTSLLGTISSTITSVTGTIGGIAAYGNLVGNRVR